MSYHLFRATLYKKEIILKFVGATYASDELSCFTQSTNMPFLATPMGKGVLADDHVLCVAPARST
jgi:2-hydroxyacyl-CoA lyase 1